MTVDRREERQEGVRKRLAQHGVDALLVTHLPNIRYLTGFSGSAALLVVAKNETILVTDFRYAVQAPREVGGSASVVVEQASVWSRLKGHLVGYGSLGFESAALSVRDAHRLGESTQAGLAPMYDVVEPLRAIKAPEEVAEPRDNLRVRNIYFEVTPLELVDAAIGRLERLNPKLKPLKPWMPLSTLLPVLLTGQEK